MAGKNMRYFGLQILTIVDLLADKTIVMRASASKSPSRKAGRRSIRAASRFN